MVDLFDRVVAGDYGLDTDVNQIFDAWEGVANRGVPLRLNEVSSATFFAGDFCNKHANGFHLRVRDAAGETLMRFIGSDIFLDKDLKAASGVTIDGVDVSHHVHSGDSNDAPQLTANSYAKDSVNIDALGPGGIYMPARRGGSAVEWHQPGTTDYTLAAKVMILGGAATPESGWTAVSATIERKMVYVTFPIAFAYPPLLFLQIVKTSEMSGYLLHCMVSGIGHDAFTAHVWHNSADGVPLNSLPASSGIVQWLAIGEKA